MMRAQNCVVCNAPLRGEGRIDRRYCRPACRVMGCRLRAKQSAENAARWSAAREAASQSARIPESESLSEQIEHLVAELLVAKRSVVQLETRLSELVMQASLAASQDEGSAPRTVNTQDLEMESAPEHRNTVELVAERAKFKDMLRQIAALKQSSPAQGKQGQPHETGARPPDAYAAANELKRPDSEAVAPQPDMPTEATEDAELAARKERLVAALRRLANLKQGDSGVKPDETPTRKHGPQSSEPPSIGVDEETTVPKQGTPNDAVDIENLVTATAAVWGMLRRIIKVG